MAKTWQEVTKLPEFQSLAEEEKERAREQYFYDVVAPKVSSFEQLDQIKAQYDADTGPKSKEPEKPPERTWTEAGKDSAIDVIKGTVGLGQAAVGIADIVTGNVVGDAMKENLGYNPEKTNEFLSSFYSKERKSQNDAVEAEDGFVNTLVALVNNPQTALGTILESAPMMLGSVAAVRVAAVKMLAARGIQAGTPAAAAFLSEKAVVAKLATIAAGSEGAMAAGSIQESAREQGRKWSESVLPAIAGGTLTGVIGKVGSKVLPDVEVPAGLTGLGGEQRHTLIQSGKEIAKGMFKEGPLEELPQSSQEQIFTNLALGKPWDEGVGSAAAQGLVAGTGMGAGMSTYNEVVNQTTKPPAEPEAPAGPLVRALRVANQTGATDEAAAAVAAQESAAAAEVDDTGLSEPPVPEGNDIQTNPEPKSYIQAQVDAMMDEKTPKDAVFVANGTEMPDNIPEGARVVEGASGTLITTNKAKAEEFKVNESDEVVAKVLGYGQSKNQLDELIKQGDEPVTMVVSDKNGTPIHEELTTKSLFDETYQRLDKAYPGQVSAHNPEEVLNARQGALDKERSQPKGKAIPGDKKKGFSVSVGANKAINKMLSIDDAYRDEFGKVDKKEATLARQSAFDSLIPETQDELKKLTLSNMKTRKGARSRLREIENGSELTVSDLMLELKFAAVKGSLIGLDDATKNVQEALKKDVVQKSDIHGDIGQKKPEQIVKGNGEPFASEATAKRAAVNRGIDKTSTIVPHKGGFAIVNNQAEKQLNKSPEEKPQEKLPVSPKKSKKVNARAHAEKLYNDIYPKGVTDDFKNSFIDGYIAGAAGFPVSGHVNHGKGSQYSTASEAGYKAARDTDFDTSGEEKAIKAAQAFIVNKDDPAEPDMPTGKEIAQDAKENLSTHTGNNLKPPTEKQIEADRYKKIPVKYDGVSIKIETAAGQKRKPEWPPLKHHYGDIKSTEGADGDAIDVFINKDNERTDTPVFIINQMNKDGTFDEHKVMLGFNNKKEARKGYADNYSKGWRVPALSQIPEYTMDQFKEWLKSGDHKKPAVIKDSLTAEAVSSKMETTGEQSSVVEPFDKTEQFIPTHETSNGIGVIASEDEAGVWIDKDGGEHEDPAIQPITDQKQEKQSVKSEKQPLTDQKAEETLPNDKKSYAEPKTYEEIDQIPEGDIYITNGKYNVRGDGKRGGGDEIYKSEQDAIAAKDRQAKNKIKLEQDAKEQAQADTAKAQAEAEHIASFKGFLGDDPKTAGRRKSVLDRDVTNNGKVTTRKKLVEDRISTGSLVNNTKEHGRILEKVDGTFLNESDITKTGMDYAEFLQGINDSENAPKSYQGNDPEITKDPELTYEQFKLEYEKLFKTMMSYSSEQAGSNIYADKMAELSDKYPEFQKRIDAEADKVPAKAEEKGVSLNNIIIQQEYTVDGKTSKYAVNAGVAVKLARDRLDDLQKLRGCVSG